MADLKATNQSLEKNLADKKRKSAEEKKRLEEELEENKSHHEKEVSDLKDKLRKQRSNTDAATASQVSQIEADLNKEWQDKCDRLLAATKDKHSRELKDAQEEKTQIQAKLKDMETKFNQLKSTRNEGDKQVMTLQDQVDEMKRWKDKYETLHSQASNMKERYEERINDLERERAQLLEDKNRVVEKARQAIATSGAQGPPDQDTLNKEVKKIMNTVFHQLKGEFETAKSYKGSDIHNTVMETIKDVTLQMMKEQEEASDKQTKLEAMIVPTGAPITGDRGNPYYAAELDKSMDKKDVIVPTASSVTGDRGNPYYAAELDKHGKEAMTKAPAPSLASSIEASIIPTGATPTGGRGNPYYAAELDKKDKSNVIMPSPAPNTGGGGGNPYYEAHLEGKTLSDKDDGKKPASGGDFLSKLEGSIIPEGGAVSKDSKPKAEDKSKSGGKSFLDQIEGSIVPAEKGKDDKSKDSAKIEKSPAKPDVLSSVDSKQKKDEKAGAKPAAKPDFMSNLESMIVPDSGATGNSSATKPDVVGAGKKAEPKKDDRKPVKSDKM